MPCTMPCQRILRVVPLALLVASLILTPQAPLNAAVHTNLVAMRDGVKLATDVYLPDGAGPWPVIFLRFPYNKALGAGVGPDATKRGYAFVAQDTRGRFASEGENLPFDADGRADGKWDGHDSAAWIAKRRRASPCWSSWWSVRQPDNHPANTPPKPGENHPAG